MNTYFLVATMMVAFFIGVLTYRQGFKDGLSVNKDKCIEPIKNPIVETIKNVQEVRISKEEREKSKELEDSMIELFSYDGNIKGVSE